MSEKINEKELIWNLDCFYESFIELVEDGRRQKDGLEKQAYEQIKTTITNHHKLKEENKELKGENELMKDVIANPGGMV